MDSLYISEMSSDKPSNDNFVLHEHNEYELYLFIEGDASYIVDGNTYKLNPYDAIIIRKNQMHRVYHNSPVKYRRYVINIPPEFFKTYNCEKYEEHLLNLNLGNKIEANIVLSSGIYDAIKRLKKYTNNFIDTQSPVVIGIVIEILYLISNVDNFSKAFYKKRNLNELMNYLNSCYTDDITLDMLEEKFYFTKHHLCRIFHNITGMTIHQYITKKRLTLVQELVQNQLSLSDAALNAGFKSYTSFYRAYINEYGISPKSGIYR